MKTAIVAAALLAGCIKTPDVPHGTTPDTKVSYLCVGMETSKRFGSCPGCELDAKRLTSLMKNKYGYSGETLISDKATKSEVVSKLKAGISNTPEDGLFLFFYSGHGGQESLGGKEPDGSDRQDEFLCLYDTYMLDDEIWDIVCSCKGRVFLYFDACHSATMYRSVKSELLEKKEPKKAKALATSPDDIAKTKGFTFRPERFVEAAALDIDGGRNAPRILCWSGCKEDEYSYGGSNGGMLTLGVVNNWKKGVSYGDLWTSARKWVKSNEPTQNPVQTKVGAFSDGQEAFR